MTVRMPRDSWMNGAFAPPVTRAASSAMLSDVAHWSATSRQKSERWTACPYPKVKPGDDSRRGLWAGRGKIECDLHIAADGTVSPEADLSRLSEASERPAGKVARS
jgi:hypothetical protein